MNSFGVEKGTTIRQPSTANLMIDSVDAMSGASSNPASLLYKAPQAFQNGFFTRLSATEVVLDFSIPNIIGAADGLGWQFAIDISGGGSSVICRVPSGFYTVAQFLDAMATQMQAQGAGTVSITQNGVLGKTAITSTTAFRFSAVQPQGNLNGFTAARIVPIGGAFALSKAVNAAPNLTVFSYIDFTSSQLTYAQDLKDNNTTQTPYDVLLRWYFATTDEQASLDKYGYPIRKGTMPFNERRIFSPPKQIKWDNNLPLGNFQIDLLCQLSNALAINPFPLRDVLVEYQPLLAGMGLTLAGTLDYKITLQLSEN